MADIIKSTSVRNRKAGVDKLRSGRAVRSKGDSSTFTQQQEDNMSGVRSFLARQPVWIVLAVASGACAAINGVFAKLTTTSLTSTLSSRLSVLLGLGPENNYVNVLLRGSFFGLNLLFNGIMWGLFTAALTKGNSTTRVSIVNVSANFFITAALGWLIFGEKLPAQWWLGAALLACGNVVIGRREEDEKPGESNHGLDQSNGGDSSGQTDGLLAEEQDLIELDEDLDRPGKASREQDSRMEVGIEADAPI